jgi:hypothetical protein
MENRSEKLTDIEKERPLISFNEKMEKALQYFYIEEEFFPADLIKYTVMVVHLPAEIKHKIVIHADFNINFFNDLKNSRFLGELFKLFPNALWMEKNFRKIKYELKEYLQVRDGGERYNLLIEFLELEETRQSVTFK